MGNAAIIEDSEHVTVRIRQLRSISPDILLRWIVKVDADLLQPMVKLIDVRNLKVDLDVHRWITAHLAFLQQETEARLILAGPRT
jgi:hypothetical protein